MGHHKKTLSASTAEPPVQSLSRLLLGKTEKKSGLDVELDDIFKTSVSRRRVTILMRTIIDLQALSSSGRRRFGSSQVFHQNSLQI